MSNYKSTPDPVFLMVDLFCGAGGVTTGAEASGVCKVVAAVNHDEVAIDSHSSNHPDVLHFTEDVRTVPMRVLKAHVDKWRARYPAAKLILWASAECTNFSDAKGGLPRDADSRTLPESLYRYILALDPHYVMVENVKEFMAWGDLDAAGRPVSRSKGRLFIAWQKKICSFGYNYEHRFLTAADFGAPTIRERYFAVFGKPGLPHAWPVQTHVKREYFGGAGMFADPKKPWKPVADVLDLADLGKSIFGRKKPLVDRTLKRILEGLRKHLREPLLMTYNTPGYCQPITQPCGALTTACHKAVVMPMLQTYYGNGQTTSINAPAPTATTKDRMALVSAQWIDYQYGVGYNKSVKEPAGAVTTSPKLALCSAFIINFSYNNTGSSVMAPCPTVVASQKSWPLGVAVAPMGNGGAKCEINATDSPQMAALKTFMRENGIQDVLMRMLKVQELKLIQGFPANYVLKGSQEQQKKHIGNSVVGVIVTEWLKAIALEFSPKF